MRHIYEFSPYMIVVYGENNADGFFSYHGSAFPISNATVTSSAALFTLTIPAPGLKLIGAGMRYTAPNDSDDDESFLNGFVKSYYSPILSSEGAITLNVSFNVTEPERSVFTFVCQTRFVGDYTDVYGKKSIFTSLPGAGLAFERRAIYRLKGGADFAGYLGLSGSFSVSGINLLCGDSGTEYVTASTIKFNPGHAAYAADSLDDFTTCAYVTFPEGGDYFCQSAESPFFSAYIAESAFAYLPLKLADLSGAKPVPMFPLASSDLERRIAAVRYGTLTENKTLFSSDETIFAATKNGLTATVDGGKLKTLVLAVDKTDLVELDITDKLRFAVQAAQPKLIFTKNPNIVHSKFTVEKWILSFSAADWQEDTRIILKYSNDISLAEWLADDETFQRSVKHIHDQDGLLLPHYEDFNRAVNDRAFTGLMILNCKAAYTGGGDAARIIGEAKGPITAHHILIASAKVGRDLRPAPALIDAVVDYSDKGAKTNYSYEDAPLDYDFVTTSVLSVIVRGETISLKTESELLINKLFGCPAAKNGDGGNALIVDGELRKRTNVEEFEFKLREVGEYSVSSRLKAVSFEGITLLGFSFALSGSLGFDVPVGAGTDLFGYGETEPLKFVDLRIVGIKRGEEKTVYSISYNNLSLRQSAARAGSFPNIFRATPSRLTGETRPPDLLGIAPLTTPISNAPLADFAEPWWRVDFPLTIGNLGALSNNESFALTIALCWRGDSFYAGVIPPFGALGSGLAMSGVLGFSAKAITLTPEDDETGATVAYTLAFTGIALKLLKFTLPSDGNISLAVRAGVDGTAWKVTYTGGN